MHEHRCQSCGLTTSERPHRKSADCIEALEHEIDRLRQMLERVKAITASDARKKQGRGDD